MIFNYFKKIFDVINFLKKPKKLVESSVTTSAVETTLKIKQLKK